MDLEGIMISQIERKVLYDLTYYGVLKTATKLIKEENRFVVTRDRGKGRNGQVRKLVKMYKLSVR